VLSIGAVPIAFDLSSYYQICIVLFALLAGRQPWIGVGLCALAAFSQVVRASGLESDEMHVWLSSSWLVFITGTALGLSLPTKWNAATRAET